MALASVRSTGSVSRSNGVVLGFALLVGGCSATGTMSLEDLGLAAGVDIQTGQRVDLGFPAEPARSVAVTSIAPGIVASTTPARRRAIDPLGRGR